MKSFQILIISFLIIVNSITVAFSQDITLSWDASPTTEVTGYKVYYKQGDMNYPFDGTGAYEGDSPVDVGPELSTTLTDLTDGLNYFFSVTAYADDSAESSYSNIVSNGWLPALLIPENGATNEPISVMFRWETAPSEYDVSYTLFYGTNQDEVDSAAVFPFLPPITKHHLPITIVGILLVLMLFGIQSRNQTKRFFGKRGLLLTIIVGGFLTACGSSGGGGSSTSSHSVATPEESVLYSVAKEDSDYHQAYDLEPSTTYYWKVVATDATDPNLTYESEVKNFTTGEF